MATDVNTILGELIETLEDGRKGYERAAEQLDDSNPGLAANFRKTAQQRIGFADELRSAAGASAGEVDSSGTAAANLHRGWLSLKDALSGDDPDAVVKAAVTGEEHALKEYQKALDADVPTDLRTTLTRQRDAIEQVRTRLEAASS